MRKVCTVVLALFFALIASVAYAQGFISLTAAQVDAFLKKNPKNIVIVDARMPNERIGHSEKEWGIKCAKCARVQAPFDLDLGFDPAFKPVFKGKKVLVVCLGGVRSAAAAKKLHEMGVAGLWQLEGGLFTLSENQIYGKKPKSS